MDTSHKPFQDLAAALTRRKNVIADHAWRDTDAEGHLAALRDAAVEIDRLTADLPNDTPVHLRHYLDNRSYDKALDFIKQLYTESAGS